MTFTIHSKPLYAHLKEGKKSYRFLLPGDIMKVSFPDRETELHASPNANLATE